MDTKKKPLPKELSALCTNKGGCRGGRLSVCTSHTSKSSSFDNLTDDLFTEILLRVPIKPLYRSKCVSKHWLSFISSTCFARSYILTDHHNDMLLFNALRSGHYGEQVYALPLLPGAAYPHVSSILLTFDFVLPLARYIYPINNYSTKVLWDVLLVGSYGGLVLLSACFRSNHPENREYIYYQYYLCNPVSKQWVELPLISTHDVVGFTCYYAQQARGQAGEVSRIWADTNSYEDIIRNNADYDPNKIDFTVVSIKWDEEKHEFIASVFSSTDEEEEWSIFHVPCPLGSRWMGMVVGNDKLVFLNGKFHWCRTNCIAAYDPFNKPLHCDIIPLPPMMDPVKSGTHRILVLEACEGRLRLVKDFFTGRFVVWDLVDYANKVWVRKHDVHTTDLFFQSLVGVAARDKVYMLTYYPSSVKLKLFDMRNKSVQHVKVPNYLDDNFYQFQRVQPFFSSPWPTPVVVRQKKLLSYINFS